MSGQPTLIDDLESLIASEDIRHRADALWRVTDLFVSGSACFSDEQVALFDDVMLQLAREIDAVSRARFGRRLASIAGAPPQIVRLLALDDDIKVAEPMLSKSASLHDDTLVEGARTKSQNHLLAISRRATLSETVTDVLVERGNRRVVASAASNQGAKFSEFGYSTLVQRSEDDDDLAVRVWSRPEIPRQHLLKLFSEASETVRARLVAADRAKAELFLGMVGRASEHFQAAERECSAEYAAAKEVVCSLHRTGQLSETRLAAFAQAGQFNETSIALSIMSDLPVGLIERALVQEKSDQVLILVKAIGLSWGTAKAILRLKAGEAGISVADLELWLQSFTKLNTEIASKAIRFYRLRERAAVSGAPR